MKTQIIQLEPHDDHISIRDKMNWSKTPRILLVFPRRRRLDLDLLDLKLLQRHARSLGAELGLVTKSLEVIRSANELGVPVFESNLAAQREAWATPEAPLLKRRPRRKGLRTAREELRPAEAKWRTHIAARIISLTLATLALLALLVAFIPQATITIEPERGTQTLTIPVRASADVQEVFLSGSIPAQTLRVILTEERSLAASGQKAVPSQGARGSVLFRNLTDLPVSIPIGTVIRSVEDDSIRFETEVAALVNAGIGEDLEVPVVALTFGESGNLDVDVLQAIEGELNFWLTATNPAPTTGGGDSFVSIPTESDRTELYDLILAGFHAQAQDAIADELTANDIVFPDTLVDLEVLDETYDPPEGETGDRVTLTINAAVEIQYANEADLAELAQAALSASLQPGFSPLPDSLRFSHSDDFATNTLGVTSWQMRVEQELLPNIPHAQIANWTQGRKLENATIALEENLALESAPEIIISPSWWRWLPLAPFRIELIVE
ncbi:MAG: hypothetical protein HN855_04725 [Anaerolineae bacterium]|jgi:hypothetical protein|nr:hypothetical protein [Anaerolineae bacterium]MBT7070400.1 hypothetical protein [Anaerolineae bacterium]MBT7324442.1 hypothetical protein [Anaerolineae bacterium]